jgi:error-prone DNA polymerase
LKSRSCGPGQFRATWCIPIFGAAKGKEKVEYPTPALEKVLGKTLGVPLFQEQAMQVAMVAAGFTPTEADQLRRAMATFKHTGGVHAFQQKLITGMLDNGYTKEFAERTFASWKVSAATAFLNRTRPALR